MTLVQPATSIALDPIAEKVLVEIARRSRHLHPIPRWRGGVVGLWRADDGSEGRARGLAHDVAKRGEAVAPSGRVSIGPGVDKRGSIGLARAGFAAEGTLA